MRAWLVVLACVAGCGSERAVVDASAAPADLAASPLTLTVAGSARPLDAWYSFYVRPLADDPEEEGVYLVITAIDPAYECGAPVGNVDALSFLLGSRVAGTSSAVPLSRHGPDLAGTSSGSGYLELDSVDDRLAGYDLDGGVVSAGSGGSVDGRVHFSVDSSISLDGEFHAARCAALDFIVSD